MNDNGKGLKILHVNYGAPPTRGGIVRYLHHTAGELAALGHRVEVLAAEWGNTVLQDRTIDGVRYRVVPARNKPRDVGDLKTLVRSETDPLRLIPDGTPDIVHVHSMMGFSLRDVEWFYRRDIPVVFTLSNYYYMCPKLERFVLSERRPCDGPGTAICAEHNPGTRRADWVDYHEAARDVLNHAEKIIAISNYVKKAYVRFGVDQDKFVRIPLVSGGCDLVRSVRPPAPRRPVRFGFFTTLAPHKGAHVAVSAFRKLPADVPARLDIWGKGKPEYEAELHRLAGPELNKRISFKGAYELDALPDMLRQMDVALAPVLWEEAQGMVVQEALAAKIPVIATDLGGIRDWVRDGENGKLIQYNGDLAGAFCQALMRVVEEPELILRWRENIPPVPSVADHAQELLDLYRRIA